MDRRRREISCRATVRALLVALALAWYTSLDRPFAEGTTSNSNSPRTKSVVAPTSRSRASSVSPFVRIQLAKPEQQQEKELSVSELAATCFFKCQTATPAFPNCCPFLGFGVCVNTQIDPNNCGKCGVRCALGSFCCAGNCTNILTDVNNCGFCGRRCPQPGACNFGFCNYG